MKKSQTTCIEAEAYGFDDLQLQDDFYQFVEEEANEHAKLKTSSSVHPEESGKTGTEKKKKDKKKSRKLGSLISWWKADKKNKHRGDPHPTNNTITRSDSKVSGKRVKAHVYFQIYSGKGPPNSSSNMKERRRLTTCGSGPLTSLFKSTKREEICESESEIPIPYMPLHQQNGPRAAVHNYGPLYVVT